MAGIAAIMTRKKREKRELGLKSREDSFSEVAEEAQKKKENFKKLLLRENELQSKKSKSNETLNIFEYYELEENAYKKSSGQAYTIVYTGLILTAIGLVISFVGLGEKGFKTTELKLIGPILLFFGLSLIIIKILQCHCPNVFKKPNFLKLKGKNRLQDSSCIGAASDGGGGGSGLVGGGQGGAKELTTMSSPQIPGPVSSQSNPPVDAQSKSDINGLVQNQSSRRRNGRYPFSPRVTLQREDDDVGIRDEHVSFHTSTTNTRPTSTIPNYIDNSSDEEDYRLRTMRSIQPYQNTRKMILTSNMDEGKTEGNMLEEIKENALSRKTPLFLKNPLVSNNQYNPDRSMNNEVILTPKTLEL